MTDPKVFDEPSNVEAEGAVIHVQGPSDADMSLTPKAALETANRLSEAAVEALMHRASASKTGG
jgi:hypothetical protein